MKGPTFLELLMVLVLRVANSFKSWVIEDEVYSYVGALFNTAKTNFWIVSATMILSRDEWKVWTTWYKKFESAKIAAGAMSRSPQRNTVFWDWFFLWTNTGAQLPFSLTEAFIACKRKQVNSEPRSTFAMGHWVFPFVLEMTQRSPLFSPSEIASFFMPISSWGCLPTSYHATTLVCFDSW